MPTTKRCPYVVDVEMNGQTATVQCPLPDDGHTEHPFTWDIDLATGELETS